MNKNSYFRINHVIKFIDEVFGNNLKFEIEGGDEIVRNVARRTEDAMGTRTILEERSFDTVFSITISRESNSESSNNMPAIFNNPDFPKILRNKYREINNIGIRYWKIDYHVSHSGEDLGSHYMFRFTVGYDDE